MADVPTNSQSSRPRTHRIKTRLDPEPSTFAFGFVLDYQCRLRWAKYFFNEFQKSDPCTLTPEDAEDMMKSLLFVISTIIPDRVYAAHPELPRLRTRLLPIEDGEAVYDRWVFALRDNTTSRNLHFPLTPEHIETVRKELGLEEDQQPQWVPLPTYVQGLLFRRLDTD